MSARGVAVLMETFTRECERLLASKERTPSPKPLVQAVKAVCCTLLSVETSALRAAVPAVVEACEAGEGDLTACVAALTAAVDELLALFVRATNQPVTLLPARRAFYRRARRPPRKVGQTKMGSLTRVRAAKLGSAGRGARESAASALRGQPPRAPLVRAPAGAGLGHALQGAAGMQSKSPLFSLNPRGCWLS